MQDIAIIGAGFSGCVLAYELKKAGFNVHVFEKSRGPGGRSSYRKVQYCGKSTSIDHGAQFIDSSNPKYIEFLESFNSIQKWSDYKFIGINAKTLEKQKYQTKSKDIYIARPHMNSLCRELLEDVDFHSQAKVEKYNSAETLVFADGQSSSYFDIVISTAPPAQTKNIFAEFEISKGLDEIKMHSQFAVLLCSDQKYDFDFDAIAVHESPIGWISINSQRPGREKEPLAIAMHTNPDWSKENLDIKQEKLCKLAQDELEKLTGFRDKKAKFISTHRWLYARPIAPKSTDKYLWDKKNKIAVAADWLCGDNLEAAWLSARSLAQTILEN